MFRTTLKKSALAAVAIAATAAAIAPAAASAATVTQSGGTLYVTAQPGETNDMRVTLTDTYLEILREQQRRRPAAARHDVHHVLAGPRALQPASA